MKQLSRSIPFSVVVCLFLFSVNGVSQESRKVAFVAAVSDYEGNAAIYESGRNGLEMEKSLKEYGYDVTSLYDFTKDEFEEVYNQWAREKASKAEVVLFYFCGHGGQLNGTGYLIPLGLDFNIKFSLENQAVNYVKDVIAPITREEEEKDSRRLRIALIDGFRKFPFQVPSFSDPGAMEEISGFAAPYYNAVDTVLIIPGRKPGEVVTEEDSGLLVEAFKTSFLEDGVKLTEALGKLDENFDKLTSPRKRGVWTANNFIGDYTFYSEASAGAEENKPQLTPLPRSASEEADALKDKARIAWRSNDLESAIAALTTLYEKHPEFRTYAKNQLRMVLVSGTLLYNPHTGKKLIESDRFDFEKLMLPAPEGLDLSEARNIFMETGKVFFPIEASEYAEAEAKSGDERAMHILGLILLNLNRDIEAVEWLKKAAADTANPYESLLYLGQLHLLGKGCEKSFEKAEEYLKKALSLQNEQAMGDAEAAVFLGHLEVEKQYEEADPAKRNFNPAAEWYEFARNSREFKGNANLGQLYAGGLAGEVPQLRRGVEIILEGAQIGKESRCMWLLSDWFRRGIFENPEIAGMLNKEAADRYALVAADLGYPDAISYCNENSLNFEGTAETLFATKEDYLDAQFRQTQASKTERKNQ